MPVKAKRGKAAATNPAEQVEEKGVEVVLSKAEENNAANKYDEALVRRLYGTLVSRDAHQDEGEFYDYLWRHLSAACPFEHAACLLLLINMRFQDNSIVSFENLPSENHFQLFFGQLVSFEASFSESESLRNAYIYFLIRIFGNLESVIVRNCVMKYASLPMWLALSKERLQLELKASPQVAQRWEAFVTESSGITSDHATIPTADSTNAIEPKKRKGMPDNKSKNKVLKPNESEVKESTKPDGLWFPNLVRRFLATLETYPPSGGAVELLLYLGQFLVLLTDLLSQLPTRRFLNTLLDDLHVVVKCRRSELYKSSPEQSTFRQLVDMLAAVCKFEVDDFSGKALSTQELLSAGHTRLQLLQQFAYSNYKDELTDLAFSSTGEIGKVLIFLSTYL